MKDNFSSQADRYARFRPNYPPELFEFIYTQLNAFDAAWDCGTGNGQVAAVLSERFRQVYATDISPQQLVQAPQQQNIFYSVQLAEATNFANNTFDVITIAQAIHWFHFERFYAEVQRVAKPHAVVAAIGYGLIHTFPEADAIIGHFYKHTVGAYWDAERRYIDEQYRTIPFPFDEIQAPTFMHEAMWDAEHLLGYLGTWSAVKHYTTAHGKNPVEEIRQPLLQAWGNNERAVQFDILLRIGRVSVR